MECHMMGGHVMGDAMEVNGGSHDRGHVIGGGGVHVNWGSHVIRGGHMMGGGDVMENNGVT